MAGPRVFRVEYWHEHTPEKTTWAEVGIEPGLGALLHLDRRCVSIQVDAGALHRYAEFIYVWECPSFVYVGAEFREDWGDCYIESNRKLDGAVSRVSMSLQEWGRLRVVRGLRQPFIGVSIPNVYARQLGFRKECEPCRIQ